MLPIVSPASSHLINNSLGMLHYFPNMSDAERYLKEAAEVLSPSGADRNRAAAERIAYLVKGYVRLGCAERVSQPLTCRPSTSQLFH
jgi:hypothetical protein